MVVEGVAGLGKSRLLGEALALAEAAGMRALRGRGSEAEREFAFGVVLQLFEAALAGGGGRGALLAGAASLAEPVFELRNPEPAAGLFVGPRGRRLSPRAVDMVVRGVAGRAGLGLSAHVYADPVVMPIVPRKSLHVGILAALMSA